MTLPKKNSIIAFPSEYVVIDVETTGLSCEYDEIIEIAAIHFLDGQIVDKYESLIHPKYEIPDFITDITGISNEMVKNAPYISEAIDQYRSFINDLPIVGHNVSFDIRFIKTSCLLNKVRSLENNYIDTMRISRKLFPELQHHRLCDLPDALGIDYDSSKAHRSFYDCMITNQCYASMMSTVDQRFENRDSFIDLFKKKKVVFDPSTLLPESDTFDESNPLFGRECVFTGVLEKMQRKTAQQIVVNFGGVCGKSVTRKTNYLILGNNDYCKSIKDGKSAKQKKAETLMVNGQNIQIIPEDIFYEIIDFNF